MIHSFEFIENCFTIHLGLPVTFGCNSLLHDPALNYFISGGLTGGMEKDVVYIVDLDTKSICHHSTMPVELKEVHSYELNGKLLVCSTFTSTSTKKLQCYTWSGANGWEVFKRIFFYYLHVHTLVSLIADQ